jgi:hypothetical protein
VVRAVRRTYLIAALVVSLAAGLSLSQPATAGPGCPAAVVHYTPYPGGAPGLGTLPWLRGNSQGLGLVALIWYWPQSWSDAQIDRARIYPGGTTPSCGNTKILWAFLSDKAKRLYTGGPLTVKGHRLDAPGRTWQRFVPIGYAGQNGAPSFASGITVPTEGCWQLDLGAGGLHGTAVFEAVSG